MRSVELIAGVKSSVLGFGCAPVLGAVGGKVAERALGEALDCGVTHFDVARSYGYGEAEAFLGRFFAGRREEVVIASKFGIRATWKAGLLRPLKPLVRALKARRGGGAGSAPMPVESQRPVVARRDPFHERVAMDARTMRSSLEQSLRALRTDYLDVLFVHEPQGGLPRLEELAEAARELKQEGKIRGWGLAFDWMDRESLAAGMGEFDVLQFNASPGAGHYGEALQCHGSSPNVLFSPLRQRGGFSPRDALRRLWADFPQSVVLCSMFDPKHIRENAGWVSGDWGD